MRRMSPGSMSRAVTTAPSRAATPIAVASRSRLRVSRASTAPMAVTSRNGSRLTAGAERGSRGRSCSSSRWASGGRRTRSRRLGRVVEAAGRILSGGPAHGRGTGRDGHQGQRARSCSSGRRGAAQGGPDEQPAVDAAGGSRWPTRRTSRPVSTGSMARAATREAGGAGDDRTARPGRPGRGRSCPTTLAAAATRNSAGQPMREPPVGAWASRTVGSSRAAIHSR